MNYKISFSKKAFLQLEQLDRSVKVQVLKKILALKIAPFTGKPLSNFLKNKRSLHVGKYRILYIIKIDKIVIVKIGHRKKVYKS